MAVCDCHELGPFADERSTNAIAPFFAPMKEASIKVSSRPSCPRANKSSANAQRMPSSTPARCHCWKRRWQVWYGPYRSGRSCQGAPVRNTHNIPFSTCRACRQGLPRWSARRGSANSTKGLIRSHCTSVRSAMPLICFKSARDSSVYSRATFYEIASQFSVLGSQFSVLGSQRVRISLQVFGHSGIRRKALPQSSQRTAAEGAEGDGGADRENLMLEPDARA